MQPILSLITRAVLLSSLMACLLAPATFAGSANPAPGNSGVQDIDTNRTQVDSPVRQRDRVREKNQFVKAYWDTVNFAPTRNVYRTVDGVQSSQVDLQPGEQYMRKVTPGASPVRVEAAGYILPTGYYMWDGRQGMVPNPTLAMPGYTSQVKVEDSGMIGPTMGVLDAIDPTHALRTTSITNAEFAMLMAARGEMMNQLRADPDRWRHAMSVALNTKQSTTSNNDAGEAERTTSAGWDNVELPLINIANEELWQPCDPEAPWKSYANAAWMVGQMYKQVFIPMAILFLLPGAVMTQTKGMVQAGFIPKGNMPPDVDSMSPFQGIMRSLIAVFLIPATQLFISYSIDVGNSLTYELYSCPYWDLQLVKDWRNQQAYEAHPENNLNYIENTLEQDMEGKAFDTPEPSVVEERQNYMTTVNQSFFNKLNAVLGEGMVALSSFQLVIMMYLFLMGPIAAALYAWPNLGGQTNGLFRYVFSAWMDGVVLVSLWKFWWALILLVMMVRLEVQQDEAAAVNDQFEMFMAASFYALLIYVPFNPFDFKPGALVAQVLDQAQSQVPKAGNAGAMTGATAPTGGGSGTGQQGASTAGAAGAGKH